MMLNTINEEKPKMEKPKMPPNCPNSPRTRSKSRSRWKKISIEDNRVNIVEENEKHTKIFEKIVTMEMKMEDIIEKNSKLFNLTKLVRSVARKSEKNENPDSHVQGIVSKVKLNPEILNYKNTIYNLNWREKRSVAGYYGCGQCDLCRCSIFGDRFKVQHNNSWYHIKDAVDCDSSNVLYLATCLMCPDHVQYGGSAVDLKKRILSHREEAESVTPTKEACPDELSHHFATVHGGWYEDGVLFQIVKTVTQDEFPDMMKALEVQELNMKIQLELFFPKGMNLRRDERGFSRLSPRLRCSLKDEDQSSVKSRWSRLDYFVQKPSKLDELSDVAKMLLKAKTDEDKENQRKQKK